MECVKRKTINVLTIDGGGVRGIISAMMLASIERHSGKPIAELFDVIAGTSTGGLLTLLLAVPGKDGKPRYSTADCVSFYERESETIFASSLWHKVFPLREVVRPKHTSKGIQDVVAEYFGEARLKDTLTEVFIPAYEIEMARPFFFRRSDARRNSADDYPLKDVVLATTAAPTFFEPHVLKPSDSLAKHYIFVDGGLVAPNPSLLAYLEARKFFPEAKIALVSIGTGDYTASIIYELVKNWGAARWRRPLAGLVIGGSADIVDHELRELKEIEGKYFDHYARLQIKIREEERNLDNADELNLHILKIMTDDWLRDNQTIIDEICRVIS